MAQASSRPLTANSIALLAPRDFVELMAPALSENDLADQTGTSMLLWINGYQVARA